ncbi:extracellular matrix protein 1-like isoform X2 [Denticeps clupeoides]|uniref:extracellular matrix protein 1-like isoform X2 n=1 Tax=Denticeps clupeoides TaxID=299321 RepID=UPI0010A50860|nr:extracellular matrix protein 1 isoform X2 [Denticeps clupeoides]
MCALGSDIGGKKGLEWPSKLMPRGPAPVLRGRTVGGPSPPNVLFPLGRPSPDNIGAICLYGTSRPRYPKQILPQSGRAHLSRQADAIHRTEAWYSWHCCSNNGLEERDKALCCAHQAWEQALNLFCQEEFSIKTAHYSCCLLRGEDRWSCFDSHAPNPSYYPSSSYSGADVPPPSDPAFSPTCLSGQHHPPAAPRTGMEQNFTVPDIMFPPGQPTHSNIKRICKLRKSRPRYHEKKCFPPGYDWLGHQARSVNQWEQSLKSCCVVRSEALACAVEKWRMEMELFCQKESGANPQQYQCCEPQGEKRYDCFASKAPDPHYHDPLRQRIIHLNPNSLGMICDYKKNLKKRFGAWLPVENIVQQCCHLESQRQKHDCTEEQLDQLQEQKCPAGNPEFSVKPEYCQRSLGTLISEFLKRFQRTCPLSRV